MVITMNSARNFFLMLQYYKLQDAQRRAPENGNHGNLRFQTIHIFTSCILLNIFLIWSDYFIIRMDKQSSRLDKMSSRQDKKQDIFSICPICWLICPTWRIVVVFLGQFGFRVNHSSIHFGKTVQQIGKYIFVRTNEILNCVLCILLFRLMGSKFRTHIGQIVQHIGLNVLHFVQSVEQA